ncbi:unnamed protein product [Ceratitis capitata]|uniref:(Mediterranean fruit fly) hypothetical protein n=1 Tax=Ceratitis capitata TaxID=7213 RepID=A0A811TYW3_CERCA|nr:unnamed protein product [Ceratitis capitata]
METQFIEDSLLSLVVLTVNGLWNNQKVNSFQDVEILCHSNKARTFVSAVKEAPKFPSPTLPPSSACICRSTRKLLSALLRCTTAKSTDAHLLTLYSMRLSADNKLKSS